MDDWQNAGPGRSCLAFGCYSKRKPPTKMDDWQNAGPGQRANRQRGALRRVLQKPGSKVVPDTQPSTLARISRKSELFAGRRDLSANSIVWSPTTKYTSSRFTTVPSDRRTSADASSWV